MPRRDAAFRPALCSVNFGHRRLSAIIPIIGTIFSALLGLILIGLAAPGKIWLFILFFFVLQRIEGDILYPKNRRQICLVYPRSGF